MKLCPTLLFVSCAVLGFGVGVGVDAAATVRTEHALACRVYQGSVIFNQYAQLANASTSTTAQLQCPVETDTAMFFVGANQATVSGYSNGSGGVTASACINYNGGGSGGGTCSKSAASSAAGLVQLNPSVGAWNNASINDYPYISIQLAPQVGGSDNVVWGYAMTHP